MSTKSVGKGERYREDIIIIIIIIIMYTYYVKEKLLTLSLVSNTTIFVLGGMIL